MKSLFDPVIEDITKLVEEQVDESKKNGGVDIDVFPIYLYSPRLQAQTDLNSSVSFLSEDLGNLHTFSRLCSCGVKERGSKL